MQMQTQSCPSECTIADLIATSCLIKNSAFSSCLTSRALDSVQSKSFAADLSNLKGLFEQSKTELFLESRAKAQLIAECQSITEELKERVRDCAYFAANQSFLLKS